jgi:CubicO group peptidase (beta-lactamase class C family)
MLTRREFAIRTIGAAAALIALKVGDFGGAIPASAQGTQVPLDAPWAARHGLSAGDYQSEFNTWTAQGYRLVDVSGYQDGGEARYAAIWQQYDSPAWQAYHGVTASDHQARFDQLTSQGYRLVHISGYEVNGSVLYAAIWEQSSVPAWQAYHGVSAADHQARFDQLTGQGYRLLDVSGYAQAGQPTYAAIWVQSDGRTWQACHGLTASDFQDQFNQFTSQGYRLVKVSGYGVGGMDYYAGVFEQSPSPAWIARHDVAGSDYQGVFDQWRYQGFRPTRVSGYSVSGQTRFAAIFESVGLSSDDLSTIQATVNGVLQKNNVPGASIAIAKDGRLVYAAGFGNLDSAGHAVSPTNVFRIASMSKAITSTTILHLLEQDQLKLTDTVFGSKGILGTTYGKKAYTANMRAITIDNLLHHTAGGWPNDDTDPMFKNTSDSQAQLIGWVLNNTVDGSGGKSLYHLATPGTQYAYSNFGYCVLGRVIEKVTGQSYATYVQQNIQSMCGINNMNVGGNTLADRRADEAQYFGDNGDDPYGMNVARMDSHGGWLASSIDYLRYMVHVDGFPTKPDILLPADITAMTTGSAANANYGMGWSLTPPNWWHSGGLPGTATIMVRTPDGFCWVALFNSRGGNAGSDQDAMMWAIHDSVKAWPSYDLF